MKWILLVLWLGGSTNNWQSPWFDDDKVYDSKDDCMAAFSDMKFTKPEKGFIAGACIELPNYQVVSPDNYKDPDPDPPAKHNED